jgi:hypothetical protein
MPHTSLTRWLKQGLDRGMCPLCRAARKLDREYIWFFFDERTGDDDAVGEVSRARGFCADHADQLKRVEVDGTKSTSASATSTPARCETSPRTSARSRTTTG